MWPHSAFTFISGFLLSGALIMAIGAQNLFVLRQGLRREHVGAIVLFCATADALLIAAGVGGAGAFLAAMPQLARLMAFGGAAFLGWHGFTALCRARRQDAVAIGEGAPVSLGRALAVTAGFTFLNPHVYLDTVLLMGAAGSAHPAQARPLFVTGAAAASFMWFAGLGYGARILRPIFSRPLAWRVLDAIVAFVMFALAVTLLARGLADSSTVQPS